MHSKRLVVTSVVRHADAEECSSFLRVVDVARGETLLTAALPESPYRREDPNPRGGLRGARGVSVLPDRLVVAASDRAFVFEPPWTLAAEITHPWMGGVHDVFAEPDALWIASTAADLLLKIGWNGTLLDAWSWREDETLVASLGFGKLGGFDESRDYRLPSPGIAAYDVVHLNSVSRSSRGLLLSFGRVLSPRALRLENVKGRLGRLGETGRVAGGLVAAARRLQDERRSLAPVPAPSRQGSSFALVGLHDGGASLREEGRGEILFREAGTRVPNHDGLEAGNLLLFNDSNRCRLVAVDQETGVVYRSVEVPGSPGFARGLAEIGGGLYAVGSQNPAAVHLIDLEASEVIRSVRFDDKPGETVYGVAPLPESFDESEAAQGR